MQLRRMSLMAIMLILGFTSACAQATPAATPVPTETPGPPTNTPRPSPTTRPTATPNLALTARADEFAVLLATYKEKEYLAATDGELFTLEPFKEEWAQLRYYQWWIDADVDADFLFSARFSWSTAGDTSDLSGCGLAFGIQPNSDHYAVFLDKSRIAFLMNRGGRTYEVGKTTGSGRVSYDNPAEADFALGVREDKAYVTVDGETTSYSLSKDQSSHGQFGYSLMSGTNRDYGTRCQIMRPMLWVAE